MRPRIRHRSLVPFAAALVAPLAACGDAATAPGAASDVLPAGSYRVWITHAESYSAAPYARVYRGWIDVDRSDASRVRGRFEIDSWLRGASSVPTPAARERGAFADGRREGAAHRLELVVAGRRVLLVVGGAPGALTCTGTWRDASGAATVPGDPLECSVRVE